MLIPVRCYSCGKVIGHLYETYQELLAEDYTEAEALNALSLDRMCCRRMILSHIDLVEDLLPYSVPVVGTMPLINPLQTPTPHRSEEEPPHDASARQMESHFPTAQPLSSSAAVTAATTSREGLKTSTSSELPTETNIHERSPEAPSHVILNVSQRLSELVGAHTWRRAELREVGQQTWEEAQRHAQAACDAVACSANAAVAAAFEREKLIEAELKRLSTRTAQFRRQMTAWATLFTKLNTELKAMGDVSNWAQCIEADLDLTLRHLDEFSERKRRALGIQ